MVNDCGMYAFEKRVKIFIYSGSVISNIYTAKYEVAGK